MAHVPRFWCHCRNDFFFVTNKSPRKRLLQIGHNREHRLLYRRSKSLFICMSLYDEVKKKTWKGSKENEKIKEYCFSIPYATHFSLPPQEKNTQRQRQLRIELAKFLTASKIHHYRDIIFCPNHLSSNHPSSS